MKFDEKLFMEKCTRLINLCDDWERYPLKILDVKNIDDSPGKHGFWIDPLDTSMTGVEIFHSVRFIKKFDISQLRSLHLPSFHEELSFLDGDSAITLHFRRSSPDKAYKYKKYSILDENSIIDFDELFRRLDLLLVETV